MKTNFSLLFYMKKPKNYQKGIAPIYLRITVNGNRSEVTTGRSCEPSRWNARVGRANGNKEEIKTLNTFLDHLQIKVYEAHSLLMEADEMITAETLRNKFQGKTEKCMTLIEVFKDHNQKMESLIGSEFKKGTAERYRTSLKHTIDFLTWKYGLVDIEIKKVDYTFISEYDYYLRSVRKCANNSAVKYLKNFGKIIRICLSNGWLSIDPFLNYKPKVKKVDRVYLNTEEILLMTNKKMVTERVTGGLTIDRRTLITISYEFQELSPEQKGAFYEYMVVDPTNSGNDFARVEIQYRDDDKRSPIFSYTTGNIDGQNGQSIRTGPRLPILKSKLTT